MGVQLTNSYGTRPDRVGGERFATLLDRLLRQDAPDAVGSVDRMSGANGSLSTIVPESLSLTITSLRCGAQSPAYGDSIFGVVSPAMRSYENLTSSAVTSP